MLDGERDLANDGLSVSWKLEHGYDPLKSDSDDDGVPDANEDPDLDLLTNVQEKLAGTSPVSADSDSDGWDDKSEIADRTNPLDEQSGPRLEGWVSTYASFSNEPASQPANTLRTVNLQQVLFSSGPGNAKTQTAIGSEANQGFRKSSSRDLSSGTDGALVFPAQCTFQQDKQMVFDEERQQMVLFGTTNTANNSIRAATWLWDGQHWLLGAPSMQPPPRSNYGFAYDPVRKQSVLFGGRVSGGYSNETWLWDGTSWRQANPADSPSPRAFASMAFDAVRQQVILFGGRSLRNERYTETWAWDGTEWARLQPANSPPAFVTIHPTGELMASDLQQEILLFTQPSDTNTAKTWIWNGIDWNPRPSASTPAASPSGGLAYSGTDRHFVFFGGAKMHETWLWNGTNWNQMVTPVGPSTRVGFSMAYDPIRRKVVLANGHALYSPASAETWLWDGADWSFWSGVFQWFDMRSRPDGIWNFTRIYVPANVTVQFANNFANTPVVWLASSNVVINGRIYLDGVTTNVPVPSIQNQAPGGPGGFAGGVGGRKFSESGSYAGTMGRGPGGSAPAAFEGQHSEPAKGPATYGNIYLQPLIGGSGGGGGGSGDSTLGTGHGRNGGGGGGAIFISSPAEIAINGIITAYGGGGFHGSGGAIRLKADRITGGGSLGAEPDGRIRLESYHSEFRGQASPAAVTSVPIPTRTFKSAGESLRILRVAGQDVAFAPSGDPSSPDVTFNATGPVSIQVESTGLPDGIPVFLRLIGNETILVKTNELASGAVSFDGLVVPKGPGIIQVSADFPLISDPPVELFSSPWSVSEK